MVGQDVDTAETVFGGPDGGLDPLGVGDVQGVDEHPVAVGAAQSSSRQGRRAAGRGAMDDLLERRICQDKPARYEYVLTERGRSLRPVIVALAAWGNRHLASRERSMILVDAASGEEVEPVLVDARTGRSLDDSEAFVFTAGPAASPATRSRYTEVRSRAAVDAP
ncbi:winged helix-turn-helix transcriptional regulator [Streptomyces sp. NBC_00433]